MAHSRRFRFGVQFGIRLGARPFSAEDWITRVRRAEELGYDTACICDHMYDQLAPLTALGAAAAATSQIRLGSLVFGNDFRHPVLLAKEIATLDILSKGRVELGLGAGWRKDDYDETGIPFESPRVRLERLEESLDIVKSLLADGRCDLDGKYYRVHHAATPRPVQRPRPPILVAGGGPRALALAARHADIVGIGVNARIGEFRQISTSQDADEAQKLHWVREAAGSRFSEIEIQVLVYFPMVTRQREWTLQMLSAQFNTSVEILENNPAVLVGTVDEIAARLEERRERYEMSYITVAERGMMDFAPVVARLSGH